MSRKKFGAQPSELERSLHASAAGTTPHGSTVYTDSEDDFDDMFGDDTDFDADDDVAFLSEDYDVMELDDVLGICNVGRDDAYDA